MHLAAITIYPVKGCYRVETDRAEVEPWGLAGDRRWLVIDPETRKAITQREVRELIRIRPTSVTGWARPAYRRPARPGRTRAGRCGPD